MKEISKEGIKWLEKRGYVKNTGRGYVNPKKKNESGEPYRIGYYKTVKGRHRYIEDYYADLANKHN